MDNEASLEINQQPVLPLANLLSQKQSQKLDFSPIGARIKSFKIDNCNRRRIRTFGQAAIDLPYFADLESYIPVVYSQQVCESLATPHQPLHNFKTIARFWWHCLSEARGQISLLVLLILFQSSSQASNLLERAKIYVDLNSQNVAAIPENSQIFLRDSQASSFNRAIRKSREISADSPFYHQAQNDINRWSEIILDIARGRAEDGDFAGAISAAKLVPQNHSATKVEAQQATAAIKDWQQKGNENLFQDYLAQAKATIDPQQASSYNRAIAILRQIAFGTKEYLPALSLIDRWNERIYKISEQRIDKGDLKGAVEAAKLISPSSVYHQLAKDEIEYKIKSVYAQYLE